MRDLSVGVAPDFRSGGLDVGQRIVGIGELVQYLTLALGLHLQGQVAGVLHAPLRSRRQDQLGPVGRHGRAALERQVVRHDQDHAVAPYGRHQRQCDPGVSAGRLDQGVTRLDLAPGLGPGDHGQGRAILDRTGRIRAFQLREDDVPARGIPFSGDALEPDQGRIADGLFDGGVASHAPHHNPA